MSKLVCKECGKLFVIPAHAPTDYGWYRGEERYCTYKCMRTSERKWHQRAEQERITLEQRTFYDKKAEPTFRKITMYQALLSEGVPHGKAARMCDFKNTRCARRAVQRWQGTQVYDEWLKAHGLSA